MDSFENVSDAKVLYIAQGIKVLKQKVNHFFESFKPESQEPVKERIVRFEVEIQKEDGLSWLRNQNNPIKTYWSDREHYLEMSGTGAADIVSGKSRSDFKSIFVRLQKFLPHGNHPVKYYGGARFSEKRTPDELWEHFSSYWFCIPRFEIITRNNKTHCACNFLLRHGISLERQLREVLGDLDQIVVKTTVFQENDAVSLSRIDVPDKKNWHDIIEKALKTISENVLGKIVLARRSTIEFSSRLDPVELLLRLKKINPDSFHFCFQPVSDNAFLGGSPERLYRRDNKLIYSEALAGTRIRGQTDDEDRKLENDLLTSDKDLREHQFVHQSVKESLERLCKSVEMTNDIKVMKLARIQHLYSSFRGTLSNGVSEFEILSALHPTSAVGGVPTGEALQKLIELESFDRGWYAGPVGWIGSNHAEFAVAIRSGLVQGNMLTLFSGAGIVTGSEPQSEWEEIENKINNFIKVLNGV